MINKKGIWLNMQEQNSAAEAITLRIKKQPPENMHAKISEIKDKAAYLNRIDDKGSINENGGQASIAIRNNKINVASSQHTNIKINGNSNQNIATSFEQQIITNKFSIQTDEITINEHKLNNKIWEYTDFKEYKDSLHNTHTVGRFCVFGSVLTKSWDHQLKKYVLIRRPAMMPMFAPLHNVPEINTGLDVEDPTQINYNYDAKQPTESAEDWYNAQKKKAIAKKKAELNKKNKGKKLQSSSEKNAQQQTKTGDKK